MKREMSHQLAPLRPLLCASPALMRLSVNQAAEYETY